jgi:hypothetical protein
MEGATPINSLPPPQTSRDQTTSNYTDILKALEAETYAEPPPPASTGLTLPSSQQHSHIPSVAESGDGSGGSMVDPHTAELHRQLQELRADMRRQRHTKQNKKNKEPRTSNDRETDTNEEEGSSLDIRDLLKINKYTLVVMVLIFVMFKFGAPKLASLSPRMFVSPTGRLNIFGTAAVSILGGIIYKASTIYV